MVSSAYLRLLIFLQAVLNPACASSSPEFLMMYSAYKLNKQGENIQPWWTPFPIWNQSVVPCPVLTVASWPARRTAQKHGREELPLAQGQRRRLRRATSHPRSRVAAERSYPTSMERWLRGCMRAKRSYSTFKVRRGGHEDIPLVQGKEQPVLCWSRCEEIPQVQGKRN